MERRGYLTAHELSDRLHGEIKVKTLANWRSLGLGPPFRKFGSKILYPVTDVERWEEANQYGSTREYADPAKRQLAA